MKIFTPNEAKEDYAKANDKNLLFQTEDKKYILTGNKVVTFEKNDDIMNCFSNFGFEDVKYPFAYGEKNIYFMVHRKYITIEEFTTSTEKDE